MDDDEIGLRDALDELRRGNAASVVFTFHGSLEEEADRPAELSSRVAGEISEACERAEEWMYLGLDDASWIHGRADEFNFAFHRDDGLVAYEVLRYDTEALSTATHRWAISEGVPSEDLGGLAARKDAPFFHGLRPTGANLITANWHTHAGRPQVCEGSFIAARDVAGHTFQNTGSWLDIERARIELFGEALMRHLAPESPGPISMHKLRIDFHEDRVTYERIEKRQVIETLASGVITFDEFVWMSMKPRLRDSADADVREEHPLDKDDETLNTPPFFEREEDEFDAEAWQREHYG